MPSRMPKRFCRMSKRQKIEVTVRDENGDITYYGSQTVEAKAGTPVKINIPFGKIMKARKAWKGVKDGEQPVH